MKKRGLAPYINDAYICIIMLLFSILVQEAQGSKSQEFEKSIFFRYRLHFLLYCDYRPQRNIKSYKMFLCGLQKEQKNVVGMSSYILK